jgi:hypothetical protein
VIVHALVANVCKYLFDLWEIPNSDLTVVTIRSINAFSLPDLCSDHFHVSSGASDGIRVKNFRYSIP